MSHNSDQTVVFRNKHIRRLWDDVQEKWYFAVVDVVEALTASSIPKRYWSDLKRRLDSEGSQVYARIVQLKFQASEEISQVKQPQTFVQNRKIAKQGGAVAGKARKAIEARTGKKVITKDSYIKQQRSIDRPTLP